MNTVRNFFIIALVVFGTQVVSAQGVDVKNKVEYANKTNELEDLNSITLAIKSVKKAKVSKTRKLIDSDVSIDDLQRMVDKKSNLRFRKKRRNTEKCFKDIENSCDSSEKK